MRRPKPGEAAERKASTAGVIALDLDGTLLNGAKELTHGNRKVLQQAFEAGWEIVPATGRFYGGMPECIRQLPFLRYAITINGARVIELESGSTLYQAAIPWQQAMEIMKYLDRLPVIYDCYMEDAAWMTEAMKGKVDAVIEDPAIRQMYHVLRQPVPELKTFLAERRQDVQKVQFFTRDMELRKRLLREMELLFPDIAVSSSSPQNIEINHKDADKGKALQALAASLADPPNREQNVPAVRTVSFGDGLNDVTMLQAADIGIAMENAAEEVKAAADCVTRSCEEDGVAWGIVHYCFDQNQKGNR
ncbi:MAG: Cof-type HAD-IIB family hydrolase [Anaerovoracaceae bacterium]